MKQTKYCGAFGDEIIEVYCFGYLAAFYVLMGEAVKQGLDFTLLKEVINLETAQSYSVNLKNNPLKTLK